MDVKEGEVVGVVGESGSGKTTLGKIMAMIEKPTSGELLFMGKEVKDPKEVLKNVSMVFQNPLTSMNPRMRVKDIVSEPLGRYDEDAVKDALEKVGLEFPTLWTSCPGNSQEVSYRGLQLLGHCQER